MNNVIVACAGSGKTTRIVKEALSLGNERILITTFTDSNTEEITLKFIKMNGSVPSNVTIMPWYTFQMTHLIKPYQLPLIDERIKGVKMVSGKSTPFISKSKKEYYLNKEGEIYSDKIAALAFETISKRALTITRLKKLFTRVYIDEFQDFAGSDLEIVKLLASNQMNIQIVCDPRQRTFSTHYEAKNKKYLYEPLKFIQEKCGRLFNIDDTSLNGSYRCSEKTIKYASTIYPEYPQSSSLKEYDSEDGIVFVKKSDSENFLKGHQKVIQLRNDKKVCVNDAYETITFGKSKGLTRDNALIYPTTTMLKFILKNDFTEFKSKSDLYVALTRATHVTGILVPDKDFDKYQVIQNYINDFDKK